MIHKRQDIYEKRDRFCLEKMENMSNEESVDHLKITERLKSV